MQSSYSLIKKERALQGEERKINTSYNGEQKEEEQFVEEIEGSVFKDRYEEIGQSIILEAYKKRDEILIDAMKETQIREKEGYDKGYNQGRANGYEDGKKEAIEMVLPEAKKKAEEILEKAENVLLSAEKDYKEYIEKKEKEILDLVITIAEKVLNKEIIEKSGIVSMVEEAIEEAKGEENLIIKCNPLHEENIKKNIKRWQVNYSIKGEIFIYPVENMELDKAIIEKNSGKTEVSVTEGLKEIKEAIFS